MVRQKPTRGFGLLEWFLAQARARQAERLIPSSHRSGRILDIGAGSFPIFLSSTRFQERFGMDKVFSVSTPRFSGSSPITLISHDIEVEGPLPFGKDYFDVVTLLAVIEHINPHRVPALFKEAFRVLKAEGLLIITSPAAWTGFILRSLASLRLISRCEIAEHKKLYSAEDILTALEEGGFARNNIQFGTFEFSMNTWVRAMKQTTVTGDSVFP